MGDKVHCWHWGRMQGLCKECEMKLSPANPSMILVRHTCPSAALAAAKKRQWSNADPIEQLQQEEVVVGGGSGLRWTALDLDEEAQVEHPRICSDSSPAQAIPRIFCNTRIKAECPVMDCPCLKWVVTSRSATTQLTHDQRSCRSLSLSSQTLVHNFWLCKAAKQIPLLSVAANKLLSAHATSAAAERNWSAWGHIYTPLRNSLSIETAEKMVDIKANMPASWYS